MSHPFSTVRESATKETDVKVRIVYRLPGASKETIELDKVDVQVPAGHNGFFTDFVDSTGALLLRLQSESLLKVERLES